MGEKEPRQKTTAIKATETVSKVRSIMKSLYAKAAKARSNGQPVAYCMGLCHYDEILAAMDIVPIWTENFAALCGTKRDSERFLMKAESEGYSSHLCGYARVGIGFDAWRHELGTIPPNAPDGGMPMPDILLGSSNLCDPRFKWYQALGRYFDVPIYNFDIVIPPVTANLTELADYYIKYQHEQLKGLVNFLESYTGKKLDEDRLWKTIRVADETFRIWYEIDRLRRAIPGPMPAEDSFIAMMPAAFYCGSAETLAFFQELYAEIKVRVNNKIGVIPEEKYRLLWGGGIPPWHTMWFFNYFERLGAVFVIDNMYRMYDPVEVPSKVKDPIEYIAWRTFLRVTQRFDKARQRSGSPEVERILEFIEDYNVDGVVFHGSQSCRAFTIGQLHWINLLKNYVKIPCLQLISDMVDLRTFSEDEWKTQIDAFVEALAAYKSGS
jgi:benzoyl-CoA reductase/2-hydroxyglutaryl-CoA dehydratase subunit BcrC/BadD/HgdB